MTLKRILTSAVVLGLGLGIGAAQAATLFTPPLVPLGQNQLDCYLVNVSNQARAVTIEVRNKEGEVLPPVFEGTLEPGQEKVATVEADRGPRYCKFVVQGSRVYFRASVLVRQEYVGSISALPAY